ncbi:MAG: hypothetical protein HYY44_00345 [Deltaproteobacteria bacterium]|nr:hypothetical protein [Deltaproteobacteria bacterium]MBI4373724.1 hypothetical protein [Deltaproteobacteria bacterium]
MVAFRQGAVRVDFLPGEGLYEGFLKSLAMPEDPATLTLAEVGQAKAAGNRYLQETTPEIFLQRAHCYTATRWLLDQREGRDPPEDFRPAAVGAIFFGACDFEKENDLGSTVKGFLLASKKLGIERTPEEIIPTGILLQGGRGMIEKAGQNLARLSDPELLAILERSDAELLASQEELLFPLVRELDKRGIRHWRPGWILLRALQRSETRWLTQVLRVTRKERERIEENLGVLPFLRSLREELEKGEGEPGAPLSVPEKPTELTRSMKLAHELGRTARPSRELLTRLCDIAENERYTDGTRMHVVSAVRSLVAVSEDPDLAALVVPRLFRILEGRRLEGRHLSRFQESWGWTLRETLETLKSIPFRVNPAQVRTLKFYLFNLDQPVNSLLALAVLGRQRALSEGEVRRSIDEGLLDALNMPRHPLAQRAAAVWLNRMKEKRGQGLTIDMDPQNRFGLSYVKP